MNGCVLGLIALVLQLHIYGALGGGSAVRYMIASVLAYVPLVIINFLIQKTLIFNRRGSFLRFLLANMLVMLLVSSLSPIFRNIVDEVIGSPWGDNVGFIISALLLSFPSFLIKRRWVFKR